MRKMISRIMLSVLLFAMVLTSCTPTVPDDETLPLAEETEMATEPATEAETEPIDPAADLPEADMFVVGGTTVGNVMYDHICYQRVGFGEWLEEFFYEKMDVHNLAVHGYTTASYHRQVEYDTLEAELGEGDYLLIAFGCNEFSDAAKDYTENRSFGNALYKHFIKLAEEKGAVPILVTPVVKLDPNDDYTGESAHINDRGDYRQAILDLGAALEIPVVDLTELTKARYEELGYDKAKTYHAVVEGQYYGDTGVIMADYSTVVNECLNARGAQNTAYLLARELQKLEGIGDYVRADLSEPEEIGVLAPNFEYKISHVPEVEKEVTVFIAGDSISAAHTHAWYDNPSLSYGAYQATFGFGTQMYRYMTDNVEIRNYAIGGTSSRSFMEQYNYQLIWQQIQPGDYLFISFGHNDKTNDNRFTCADKDHTDPASIGYYLNEYYIKPAREKGAIPILFTPAVYLNADDNYTGITVHDVDTGNYPQAIRDVGEAFDVPVVDLTAISKARYEELGYEEAKKYHPITDGNLAEDGVTIVPNMDTLDFVHYNLYGARYMAYRIACELQNVESIRAYIRDDLTEPTEELITVNPYYIFHPAE